MTTPTLEAIAGTLFDEPSDDDLKTCMSKILPTVRGLVDRGLPESAIVQALAQATLATIEQRKQARLHNRVGLV
jgi:hypothetical protein